MWIESHQSLRDHPKLIRAARRLKISRPQMIGHLHCLWWWALDYAQDGNLSAYDADDIAAAAEWTGDAADFVNALADAARIGDRPGFLALQESGAFSIHDWNDYAGKLLDKRAADAARKRLGRQTDSAKTAQGVQWTSYGHPTDIHETAQVPNLTVPNLTVPNQPDAVSTNAAPPSTSSAATPPPNHPKSRKQKPPLVEENRPPEIDALHGIVGVYPPRETWDTLAAAASGYTEAQMRQTYAAWRTVTPNKHNWTWVVEWLPHGGKPPSPYSKPNGKAPLPPGCPPPEQLWGLVQREIDRVHSYGKPELPAQIMSAIESVGGWYTVCKCDPEGPTPARLRDAYRSVIHG